MTSRRASRLLAALVGLLYLLAWGEPVSLHPCPMHDGVAVAASAHAGAHGAAHAGMHHAAADVAMPAGHHAPAGDASHLCQCLGHGCGAAGVAVPTAQAVRWQVVVTRLAEPPHAEPASPRGAPARLLPFANGPPALA